MVMMRRADSCWRHAFVFSSAYLYLFAVADDLYTPGPTPAAISAFPCCLCTALTEFQVVRCRSAIICVATDEHANLRMRLQITRLHG